LDSVLWNDWHVIADARALRHGQPIETTLLGVLLQITRGADGGVSILRQDRVPLLGDVRYGFVWTCLGTPARPIIAIPEMDREAKCIVSGGAIAVRTSAGRVIENFLDLAHLGYVHAGYLGAEPRTAVENYTVRRLPDGGIQAIGCRAFQPLELQATRGADVEYSYEVKRPLIASFDKSDLSGRRFVVMYIFAQPVDEERTVAHTLALILDEGFEAAEVRAVMQFIFLQDKPILENQHPKRLPIGPLMEMPMMADKMSIAYRRWLAELGLTYGTIRAREEAVA
jgi:phenylpropionate dioxygenase-like ring-hydroxylating dioxygenase large terminal subunit